MEHTVDFDVPNFQSELIELLVRYHKDCEAETTARTLANFIIGMIGVYTFAIDRRKHDAKELING